MTLLAPHNGIDTSQRERTSVILQERLNDWIALELQLKHAHWNLIGPQFRAVHEQLDEVTADVRTRADDIAERIVTLGPAADGQADFVANNTKLKSLPRGRYDGLQFVEALVDNMALAVRSTRASLDELGELDPVSEDLVIGVTASLEKHAWMLRALLGR